MSSLRPADYYATVFPQQYANALANASAAVLDQPDLTTTLTITGEEGGVVGLRASGATLTYVPGGIPDADMQVTIGIADWYTSVEHGASEAIMDYVQRRKVQVVKSLKGSVTLDLGRSDGSTLSTTTIFGQTSDPAVTLIMTVDDYTAMLRGELNGQMAFMMGRLKFEGSLPLLMAIGSLAGM
jgi:putative sterol carrier protein